MDENKTIKKGITRYDIFFVIIAVLLICNIAVSLIPTNAIRTGEMQETESRLYNEYHRSIAEKAVKVEEGNVIKSTSTYSSDSLPITVTNTSNKDLESVSVTYYCYNNDEFVNTAYKYISYLPAGSSVNESVSLPKGSNKYSLHSITASNVY